MILWSLSGGSTGLSNKPIKCPRNLLLMTEKELFEAFGLEHKSAQDLEEEKLKQYRQAKQADAWLFNETDSLPE